MRQGARPGTPDRLAARRVASPWLTQGKGYLRLNVRDGFVVAGEYGWLAEEVVLETAGGDEPLDYEATREQPLRDQDPKEQEALRARLPQLLASSAAASGPRPADAGAALCARSGSSARARRRG